MVCLAAVAGAAVVYTYMYPKAKICVELDEKTRIQNEELRTEQMALTKENANLLSQKESVLQNIEDLKKQAKEASEIMYEQSIEIANEKMSAAAEKMSAEFEKAKKEVEQEYLNLIATNSEFFHNKMAINKQALETAEARLADLSAKVQAAIEAAKRQEEAETAQDFYRLNLSNIDIEEIIKLRQVTVLLRDSEPLNKVIWKVYYEKPYSDLIGRVVGSGTHTGIYKITNIENQKCYVGQAANIADRWKQHIKRGIGAEAPTRNKLYPAMLQYGVENFTFEIIEECPREKLNDREDYWQEYFGAREFGYSIK